MPTPRIRSSGPSSQPTTRGEAPKKKPVKKSNASPATRAAQSTRPVTLTKVAKGAKLLDDLVARADRNGDGYITDAELGRALAAVGADKPEVLAALRAAHNAGRASANRSVDAIQAKIQAAKQKIVNADDGDGKITKEERPRIKRGRGGALANALLDLSGKYAGKSATSLGLGRPVPDPTTDPREYGHVSREGTPGEVMQRIVRRWNRLGDDNYWPGHQHIRSVLTKQQAKDVAGEIAALPRTLARSVLRELSAVVVAGGANSIWADAEGAKELKKVARRFGLGTLSFTGPSSAPHFDGY